MEEFQVNMRWGRVGLFVLLCGAANQGAAASGVRLQCADLFVAPAKTMFQTPEQAKAFANAYAERPADLDAALIEYAQTFSTPPVSNYRVGAYVRVAEGAVVLGTNMEFPGRPLNDAIHGEQFAVILARELGFKEIESIHISAEPCGHCRQFLTELNQLDLPVLVAGKKKTTLSALLPHSFGPANLGFVGGMLTAQAISLGKLHGVGGASFGPSDAPISELYSSRRQALAEAAQQAASNSYSPVTKLASGVALLLENGAIVKGSYVENSAFNPAVAPAHAALIVRRGLGLDEFKIVAVAAAETQRSIPTSPSYLDHLGSILKALDFAGPLETIFYE